MVTVNRLPNGDPFAIVIDPQAQAQVVVAADRSSVTIIVRQSDRMPCSLIFPADVAEQIFGPDFAFVLPEVSESDGDASGNSGPAATTGGGR